MNVEVVLKEPHPKHYLEPGVTKGGPCARPPAGDQPGDPGRASNTTGTLALDDRRLTDKSALPHWFTNGALVDNMIESTLKLRSE